MTALTSTYTDILAFFNWGPALGGFLVLISLAFVVEGLRLSRKPAMEGQQGSQTIFRHYAAGAVLLLVGSLVLLAGSTLPG